MRKAHQPRYLAILDKRKCNRESDNATIATAGGMTIVIRPQTQHTTHNTQHKTHNTQELWFKLPRTDVLNFGYTGDLPFVISV
jgi:hypothetical protein